MLDANDDGMADIMDVVLLVDFIFHSGATPKPPFLPACDVDPTDDGLGCKQSNCLGRSSR